MFKKILEKCHFALQKYRLRDQGPKAPAFFFEKVINSAAVLIMTKDVASHSLAMHSSIEPFGAGLAKGRTRTVKLQPRGFLNKNGVTTAPVN